MEFDNIFNGTILVLWALVVIPHALKEDKKWLISSTGAVMLVIEILLSMHYAEREFPYNFIAGVLSFLVALSTGFAYYYFHEKPKED